MEVKGLKALTAENPWLSKVAAVKLAVGQNIASHASPSARNSAFLFFVLFVVSPIHKV